MPALTRLILPVVALLALFAAGVLAGNHVYQRFLLLQGELLGRQYQQQLIDAYPGAWQAWLEGEPQQLERLLVRLSMERAWPALGFTRLTYSGERVQASSLPHSLLVDEGAEGRSHPWLSRAAERTLLVWPEGAGTAMPRTRLVLDLTPLVEQSRQLRRMAIGAWLLLVSLLGLLLAYFRYAAQQEMRRTLQPLRQEVADLKSARSALENRFAARNQELEARNSELALEVEERQQAESQLQTQQRFLRAVMDNLFNGIVVIDERGLIESVNPSVQRMFGYNAEELIGRNVSVLMPDTHRGLHDGYIRDYVSRGDTSIIGRMRDILGRRKDGSEFPMEVAVTEIESDGARRFVGTVRDISERRQAEKELDETRQKYYHQEKMAAIGTLAAGIVHEIGNPTAALLGLIQELREVHQETLSDEVQSSLVLMQEQVERVMQITRDISEFSSPRQQGPQWVDINGMIGRTVRLMRHDRRFRSIDLVLDLDSQLPAAWAIESQLVQVMLNLLTNAADALAESAVATPRIDIRSGLQAGRIHIVVEDNGCGMAPDVLKHALEAFYTTKAVGHGTGLGLSLCHSLITAQNGELRIASESGRGARIDLLLPVEQARAR